MDTENTAAEGRCYCWTPELQRLWDHYISVSPDLALLKANAMQRFLKVYTAVDRSRSCDAAGDASSKRCMRANVELTSVGNVIMREFLLRIKAACMAASPATVPDGGGAPFRADSCALLRHFLIEDEGWMFLDAMLQTGARGLSCGRDLTGLLISLFTMCMRLAVLEGEQNLFVDSALPDEAHSAHRYMQVSSLCAFGAITDASTAELSARLWPRRQSAVSRLGNNEPSYGSGHSTPATGLCTSRGSNSNSSASLAVLLQAKLDRVPAAAPGVGSGCSDSEDSASCFSPPVVTTRCRTVVDVGVYCLCLLSSMCPSTSPSVPLAAASSSSSSMSAHVTANADLAATVATELTKSIASLYLGSGSGSSGGGSSSISGSGAGRFTRVLTSSPALLWLQRHCLRVAVRAACCLIRQLQTSRPLASLSLLQALLAVGYANVASSELASARSVAQPDASLADSQSACSGRTSADDACTATSSVSILTAQAATAAAAMAPSKSGSHCCGSSSSTSVHHLSLLLAADAVQGALELLATGFTHGQQQGIGQMAQLTVDFCESGGTWLAAVVARRCHDVAVAAAESGCASCSRARAAGEMSTVAQALLDGAALALCALKNCKVKYVHAMTCLKKGHRKCNYEAHYHHHHDAFAVMHSLSALRDAACSGGGGGSSSSSSSSSGGGRLAAARKDTGYDSSSGSGSSYAIGSTVVRSSDTDGSSGGGIDRSGSQDSGTGRSSCSISAYNLSSFDVCDESRHCAAAALSELLLRSFAALPYGSPSRAASLDLIARSGLCCCLPLGLVVRCLLAGVENESHALQDAALGVLSTSMLHHLGGAGAGALAAGSSAAAAAAATAAGSCSICQQFEVPSDRPVPSFAAALGTSAAASNAAAWRRPDAGRRRWHDVSLLGDLLQRADERLGVLVLRHVGGALRTATDALRQELFVSVYFSHIQMLTSCSDASGIAGGAVLRQQSSLPPQPVQHESSDGSSNVRDSAARLPSTRRLLVRHCLRALPSLLTVSAVRQMFVACSGVELLEACARSAGLLRGSLKVYVVLMSCLDGQDDTMAAFCRPEAVAASFLDLLLADCPALDSGSGIGGCSDLPSAGDGSRTTWLRSTGTGVCRQMAVKWRACGLLLTRCRKLLSAFERRGGPGTALRLLRAAVAELTTPEAVAAGSATTEVAAAAPPGTGTSRSLSESSGGLGHSRCARRRRGTADLLKLTRIVLGVCQQCVHLLLSFGAAEIDGECSLLAYIDDQLLRKLPTDDELLMTSVASVLIECAVQRTPQGGPVLIDDNSGSEADHREDSDSSSQSGSHGSSGERIRCDGVDPLSQELTGRRNNGTRVASRGERFKYGDELLSLAISSSDPDDGGMQSDNESSSTNGYDADNELNHERCRLGNFGSTEASASVVSMVDERKLPGNIRKDGNGVNPASAAHSVATAADLDAESLRTTGTASCYDYVEIAWPRLLQMTTAWVVKNQHSFSAKSLQRVLHSLLRMLNSSSGSDWAEEKQDIVENLLTGFHPFLTHSDEHSKYGGNGHKRGLQTVLSDLIVVLCSKNITTRNLLRLLALLKSCDHKGPLLDVLHSIVTRSTFQPRYCIAFPQKSALHKHASTAAASQTRSPPHGPCHGCHPWGVDVAMAKSHLLDKFFPWKEAHCNFSIVLWLLCSGSLPHHRAHHLGGSPSGGGRWRRSGVSTDGAAGGGKATAAAAAAAMAASAAAGASRLTSSPNIGDDSETSGSDDELHVPPAVGRPSSAGSTLSHGVIDRYLHLASVGNRQLSAELWVNPSCGNILARFMSRNIGEEEVLSDMIFCNIFTTNRWQHLCASFSIDLKDKQACLELTCVIDGCRTYHEKAWVDVPRRKLSLSSSDVATISVGHSSSNAYGSQVMSIGNVLLFRDVLPLSTCQQLYSEGPDATSFMYCECDDGLVYDASTTYPVEVLRHVASADISRTSELNVRENRKKIADLLCMVMAPELKQYCIVYPWRPVSRQRRQPIGPFRRLVSVVGRSSAAAASQQQHQQQQQQQSPQQQQQQPQVLSQPPVPSSVTQSPAATATSEDGIPEDVDSQLLQIQPISHSVAYERNTVVRHQADVVDALVPLGGVELALFLFAKTVESAADTGEQQALALEVLLHLTHKSTVMATEFARMSGPLILSRITGSSRFRADCAAVMKVLLKYCFCNVCMTFEEPRGGLASSDNWSFGQPNALLQQQQQQQCRDVAIIRDSTLVRSVLLDCATWQKATPSSAAADSRGARQAADVWHGAFVALRACVSTSNVFKHFNVQRIVADGVLARLLVLPLEWLRHAEDSLRTSVSIADTLVEIIEYVLTECQASESFSRVFHDVCNLLLLLHPAAATFVHYDKRLSYIQQCYGNDMDLRRSLSHGLSKASLSVSGESSLGTRRGSSLTEINLTPASDLSQDSRVSPVSHGHHRSRSSSCPEANDASILMEVPQMMCSRASSPLSTTHSRGTPTISVHQPADQFARSVEVSLDSNLNEIRKEAGLESDGWDAVEQSSSDVNGTSTLHCGLLSVFGSMAQRMGSTAFLELTRKCNLTLETLIVYLNHESALVRLHALQLFGVLLGALPEAEVVSFVENEGFFLIAGQLRQHQPTPGLVEVCLSLLRCCPAAPCCMLSGATDYPEPLLLSATVPLMAMLDKMVSDPALLIKTLSSLRELFGESTRFAGYLCDRGLFESLCNTMIAVLHHVQSIGSDIVLPPEYEVLANDLRHFMTDVSIYLLSMVTLDSDVHLLDEALALLITIQKQQAAAVGTDREAIPSWYAHAVDKTILEIYMGIFKEIKMQALVLSPASVLEKGDRTMSSSGLRLARSSAMLPTFPGPAGSELASSASLQSTRFSGSSARWRFIPRAMKAANVYTGGAHGKLDMQLLRIKLEWLLPHAIQYVMFRAAHFRSESIENAAPIDSGIVITDVLSIVAACTTGHCTEPPSADGADDSAAWYVLVSTVQPTLKTYSTQLAMHFLSPDRSLEEALMFVTKAELLHSPQFGCDVQVPCEMVKSFTERCGHRLTARQQSFVTQLGGGGRSSCSAARPGIVNQAAAAGQTGGGSWNAWSNVHSDARRAWHTRLQLCIRRGLHRTSLLLDGVSQMAMKATRNVVNVQNLARRELMDYVKTTMASGARVESLLKDLIQRMTHERAVWHDEQLAANAWQLDPTEGPGRMRKRLMPCRLRIEPRRLQPKRRCASKAVAEGGPQDFDVLAYLFEDGRQVAAVGTTVAGGLPLPPSALKVSRKQQVSSGESSSYGSCRSAAAAAVLVNRLDADEKIVDTYWCINVALHSSTQGELLVGQKALYFAGDDVGHGSGGIDVIESSSQVARGSKCIMTCTWSLEDIEDIQKRRHRLQDTALEIFLTSGRTTLIAFETEKARDSLLHRLEELGVFAVSASGGGKVPQAVEQVQALWLDGRLTNFEYLMYLNTAAGRSFNDLMQYPVFPYVLSDYESPVLNLYERSSYRNLLKPIACQKPENESRYIAHYKEYENHRIDSVRGAGSGGKTTALAPYHYASLYSNSGVVLHYLVRLLPYTLLFLQYQDGNFDLPDRTFHSLATSWHLSSDRSQTDVKELTPEFFSMHEFLCNDEGFEFGRRHGGQAVHDVELPQWCQGDPRLFILVHRQVLESSFVSCHLSHWIDMIFGYKQIGKAAIEAVNVFHPATYHGLDLDTIDDELQRRALAVMIQTYGQVPRQLFKQPHPSSADGPADGQMSTLISLTDFPNLEPDHLGESLMASRLSTGKNASLQISPTLFPVLKDVIGLRWGAFVGSPDCGEPALVKDDTLQEPVHLFVALPTGQVLGHSRDKQLIVMLAPSSAYKGMASKRLTLWPSEPKSAALLHWSTLDNVLRRRRTKLSPVTNFAPLDGKASCCAVSLWNCKQLILGYHTGIVKVYPLEVSNKAEKKVDAATSLGAPVSLYGHLAAVRHVFVCMEYSIFVSVDEDGIIIIWDLNRLTYVRSLTVGTPTSREIVDSITVSATLGDIAIASHGADALPTSTLRVFTINARPVGTRCTAPNELISCVTYSTLMEGRGVNVVAGGLNCGVIRLWSSWDLQHVKDIRTPNATDFIISVAFSYDCQQLIAVTQANRLLVWERGPTFARQPSGLSSSASTAATSGGSSAGSSGGRRQQQFSYWSEL